MSWKSIPFVAYIDRRSHQTLTRTFHARMFTARTNTPTYINYRIGKLCRKYTSLQMRSHVVLMLCGHACACSRHASIPFICIRSFPAVVFVCVCVAISIEIRTSLGFPVWDYNLYVAHMCACPYNRMRIMEYTNICVQYITTSSSTLWLTCATFGSIMNHTCRHRRYTMDADMNADRTMRYANSMWNVRGFCVSREVETHLWLYAMDIFLRPMDMLALL